MRKMTRAIFPFFWKSEDDQTLKIVTDYHQKYKQVDELLQNMPEVLQFVHNDLIKRDNENVKSREADFTSENLFRALVLMQTEGWVLRETTVRINDSEFFQKFCRLSHKQSIDFTLLDKAYHAIEPQTWEIINQHFAVRMKKRSTFRRSEQTPPSPNATGRIFGCSETDERSGGRDDESVSEFSCRNRGNDFVLKTSLSTVSVLFSRI